MQLQEKLTVVEALRLYSVFYPRPADWRALAAELRLEAVLKTRFGKLSGGRSSGCRSPSH